MMFMMKKKNQILVTLSVVALLGGCSEDEVQRDVYNSLDDCIADWIRPELCEADQSQTANTGNNMAYGNSHLASSHSNAVNDPNNTAASDNNTTSTSTVSGHEGPSMGSAIAGAAAGYMMTEPFQHQQDKLFDRKAIIPSASRCWLKAEPAVRTANRFHAVGLVAVTPVKVVVNDETHNRYSNPPQHGATAT